MLHQRAMTATIPVPTHKTELPGVSCGFRPCRGMHDASDALAVGMERRKASWIVDTNKHGFPEASSCFSWLAQAIRRDLADCLRS